MSIVSFPRPVGRIPMLVMATAHAGRTLLLATLLTITKWIRSQTMPALYPPGHEEKMRQARFLFRCGYITAGGMIARVAIERHLIKTCKRVGIDLPKKASVGTCSCRLREAIYIDLLAVKRIERIVRTGNRVAHGHRVEPNTIARMIMSVEIVCQSLDKIERQNYSRARIDQEAVPVPAGNPTPDAWHSRSGYIPIEPEELPRKPR